MPAQEPPTLRTAYAEKVAADLAKNAAEQDRIRSEMEQLRTQLTTLEADHALLTSVNSALTGTTVPTSRRNPKSAGSVAPVKKSARQRSRIEGPPLTELVYEHLVEQNEPRTAREIAQALTESHPDRTPSDNLVRTTTERLVARSRVERFKQGSTVYYTAAKTGNVPASAPAEAGVTAN